MNAYAEICAPIHGLASSSTQSTVTSHASTPPLPREGLEKLAEIEQVHMAVLVEIHAFADGERVGMAWTPPSPGCRNTWHGSCVGIGGRWKTDSGAFVEVNTEAG